MSTEVKITVRPSTYESVKIELAAKVGQLVYDWCSEGESLEDCIDSSKRILEYNYNEGGYELAKEFEEEGFSPDKALVDELDSVSWIMRDLVREKVKIWVKQNNILPEFPIGTIVEFQRGTKKIIGEIMKHYQESAEYLIWFEGCTASKGNGGTIIAYENATKHQPI